MGIFASRSNCDTLSLGWKKGSVDFPQAHVSCVSIGVVGNLDGHELCIWMQVYRILETSAEDACLGAADVAHLVHPAISLSVLDRGIAQQLRICWVVHDPHLHGDASNMAVALHGDESATLLATSELASCEVRGDGVPALGLILLKTKWHIVLAIVMFSPPTRHESVLHLALILDNFVIVTVLELPLELDVVLHSLIGIQDNSATFAASQSSTVSVNVT